MLLKSFVDYKPKTRKHVFMTIKSSQLVVVISLQNFLHKNQRGGKLFILLQQNACVSCLISIKSIKVETTLLVFHPLTGCRKRQWVGSYFLLSLKHFSKRTNKHQRNLLAVLIWQILRATQNRVLTSLCLAESIGCVSWAEISIVVSGGKGIDQGIITCITHSLVHFFYVYWFLHISATVL